MKTSLREARRRRIVVVFGGGGSDTSLVDVLRSLVSESGADIAGVFLEDQSLFRVAELPFITEVSRLTTARRRLAPGDLERQLKVQARHAERELRTLAESLGLPWSFRTYRGPLSRAIAEASRFDLLLLGAAGHALGGEWPLTARTSARSEWNRPIAALLEQADTDRHTLEASIEVAKSTGRPLIVFATGSVETHRDIRDRLQALGPRSAAVHLVPEAERGALLSRIRRASPAMLLASAGEEGLQERQIATLRRELRCPVIVVRGESG